MAKVEIKIVDIDTAKREVETEFSITPQQLKAAIDSGDENVKATHLYTAFISNSFKQTHVAMRSGRFDSFLRFNSPKAVVTILIYDKESGGIHIECSPNRQEISSHLKKKGVSPAMVFALEALEAVVKKSRESRLFLN